MIYFKIDELSCVVDNINLFDLFELFRIDMSYYPDFLVKAHDSRASGARSYSLSEYGVQFDISLDEYKYKMAISEYKAEEFDLFYTDFEKIRVEFHGQGLDWLRSFYPQFDDDIRKPDFFGNKSYRITRVDFAYDFVNVHSDFISNFSKKLLDIEYDRRISGDLSERLTLKKNSYLTYEVVMGPTGLTIYLGSKKSNKFVRVYDKLMERCAHGMAEVALPVFDHPLDEDIRSWFRIEYQVRKKYCADLLYGCDERGESVLKYIFDHYRVSDRGERIECLDRLMDWSRLPELRKMKNIDDSGQKTVYQKSEEVLNRDAARIIMYILRYGIHGLLHIMVDYIDSCYVNDLKGANRRLALARKLALALREEGMTPYDLTYLDAVKLDTKHFVDFRYEKLYDDLSTYLNKLALRHRIS